MSSPHKGPGFDVYTVTPRATHWVVCVFVLNECERAQAQLRKMTETAGDLDIVVADGSGSTRRTAQFLSKSLDGRPIGKSSDCSLMPVGENGILPDKIFLVIPERLLHQHGIKIIPWLLLH